MLELAGSEAPEDFEVKVALIPSGMGLRIWPGWVVDVTPPKSRVANETDDLAALDPDGKRIALQFRWIDLIADRVIAKLAKLAWRMGFDSWAESFEVTVAGPDLFIRVVDKNVPAKTIINGLPEVGVVMPASLLILMHYREGVVGSDCPPRGSSFNFGSSRQIEINRVVGLPSPADRDIAV